MSVHTKHLVRHMLSEIVTYRLFCTMSDSRTKRKYALRWQTLSKVTSQDLAWIPSPQISFLSSFISSFLFFLSLFLFTSLANYLPNAISPLSSPNRNLFRISLDCSDYALQQKLISPSFHRKDNQTAFLWFTLCVRSSFTRA